MDFDEIHTVGPERHPLAWLPANRAAIAAARYCGFDPSDVKTKKLLSLVCLRVLDVALSGTSLRVAEEIAAKVMETPL